MKEDEIEQLAIDYCNVVIQRAIDDESDPADRLITLMWHDPESAWEVAMRVLRLCPGEDAASIIGAGTLEDLLHNNPEQFVERAINLAEHDERVSSALTYVDIRQGEIPDDLFIQFERARDEANTRSSRK
jgi:uncharacterized protein DUF6869